MLNFTAKIIKHKTGLLHLAEELSLNNDGQFCLQFEPCSLEIEKLIEGMQ